MHSNLYSRISLSLAALAASLCAAAAPALRVEITYDVSRNGSAFATALERLEHDGKAYRISATLKGKGIYALRGDIKRTSRGAVVAGALRPAEFEDVRTGRDTVRAKFDWQNKTLTQQHAGVPQVQPLPADAQDRLSFLYSFAFHTPGAAPVSFSVVDGKGISRHVYQAAGRETLKTPAGEFETLKLAKHRDNPDARSTEIWLALQRGFVPVRILVVEKDGTRVDQVATRVSEQ